MRSCTPNSDVCMGLTVYAHNVVSENDLFVSGAVALPTQRMSPII